MSIMIDAVYASTMNAISREAYLTHLTYSRQDFHQLNQDLLNLTYNICGVARDVPKMLGFDPMEEVTLEVDWDDVMSNVTELLVHRDMIEKTDLLEEVLSLASFAIHAYRAHMRVPVAIKCSF